VTVSGVAEKERKGGKDKAAKEPASSLSLLDQCIRDLDAAFGKGTVAPLGSPSSALAPHVCCC
jgi:hypothetical protein